MIKRFLFAFYKSIFRIRKGEVGRRQVAFPNLEEHARASERNGSGAKWHVES